MGAMQEEKQCYLCGRYGQLELHHCIHGRSNRKNADKYGLTVYLCMDCHWKLHNKGENDLKIITDAQKYFEENIGTREEFRKIFGKSWL